MTSTLDCLSTAAAAPRPRPYGVVAGILSGAGALAVGEFAGRLVPGAVSPIVAVANRVVELAPDGPRRAGIRAFGSLDKPLLLGAILLVVVVLAGWCGVLAQRHQTRGELAVAGLAVVVLAASLPDNASTATGAVLTAVGMLLVGVSLLRLLTSRPAPVGGRPAPSGVDRRHFFIRSAVVGVGAIAAGGFLKVLDARAEVGAVRAKLGLPTPVRRAPGNLAAADLGVPGISPVMTANRDFYRIDTALVVPQVDSRTWSMGVRGRVDRQLSLTYDQLLAMPQVEADITIACVSNEVGGD
ncbi:MAG: molybdopterin-dependent oxidoreductase, partial [Frankiales bacterium]|nr:molybdopterin-dependent oxidoreductase [Frankiales bacterium]